MIGNGFPIYLLAGEHQVDLTHALAKIRAQLGVRCVVSEAGGGLNGALLRAGLVDELHIITIPALIGGLGTPSIMDGPPLESGALPQRLRTIDVQVGNHGTIWAHYEVGLGERDREVAVEDAGLGQRSAGEVGDPDAEVFGSQR